MEDKLKEISSILTYFHDFDLNTHTLFFNQKSLFRAKVILKMIKDLDYWDVLPLIATLKEIKPFDVK